MSAPKHLWSGDWEHESAATSEELANRRARRRVPEAPAPAPTPSVARPAAARPRPAEPRPRRQASRRRPLRLAPRLKQMLPLALALLLIVAAGAYGLSSLLSSSPPAPAELTTASTAPVSWLGMQLETLPPGTVVIETVAPGSTAERAGLEPGDVIVEVNGTPINATGEITGAISHLHGGAYVPIEVTRGSTLFSTQAAMAGPPSSHP